MISRRALELGTAALTGSFGVAVVVSSLGNGIGWSRAGVDAGTFPFLTGLIILLGSLFNVASGWLRGRTIAITLPDLRRLAGLFLPAAAFIAIIPLIGLYPASGGYMLATLALQHRAPLLRSALIAVATPLVLYLVFERMFRVSLPHGLLGDVLGF